MLCRRCDRPGDSGAAVGAGAGAGEGDGAAAGAVGAESLCAVERVVAALVYVEAAPPLPLALFPASNAPDAFLWLEWSASADCAAAWRPSRAAKPEAVFGADPARVRP